MSTLFWEDLPLSGGGGGGAVTSVSNSDGTLTISPTTGDVVASINPSSPDVGWANSQTFGGGLFTNNITAIGFGVLTFTTTGAGSEFTDTVQFDSGLSVVYGGIAFDNTSPTPGQNGLILGNNPIYDSAGTVGTAGQVLSSLGLSGGYPAGTQWVTGSGGAYWTQSGNLLYPTTNTNQVLVNRSTDDGTSAYFESYGDSGTAASFTNSYNNNVLLSSSTDAVLVTTTSYPGTGLFAIQDGFVALGDWGGDNFNTAIVLNDNTRTVVIEANGGITLSSSSGLYLNSTPLFDISNSPGASGTFLGSTGSAVQWQNPPAPAVPGGLNGDIQYNSSGGFAGANISTDGANLLMNGNGIQNPSYIYVNSFSDDGSGASVQINAHGATVDLVDPSGVGGIFVNPNGNTVHLADTSDAGEFYNTAGFGAILADSNTGFAAYFSDSDSDYARFCDNNYIAHLYDGYAFSNGNTTDIYFGANNGQEIVTTTSSGYTFTTNLNSPTGGAAGSFTDSLGNAAALACLTYAGYFSQGSTSSGAGFFQDTNSNMVTLGNGAYGIYSVQGTGAVAAGYFQDYSGFVFLEVASNVSGTEFAAQAGDSNGNLAYLCNQSYALQLSDGFAATVGFSSTVTFGGYTGLDVQSTIPAGLFTANLTNPGEGAASFTDPYGNSVLICDNVSGINLNASFLTFYGSPASVSNSSSIQGNNSGGLNVYFTQLSTYTPNYSNGLIQISDTGGAGTGSIQLGDWAGDGNATRIDITDSNQRIILAANGGIFFNTGSNYSTFNNGVAFAGAVKDFGGSVSTAAKIAIGNSSGGLTWQTPVNANLVSNLLSSKVSSTNLSAAISSTALFTPSASAYYRITWNAVIATAASTSSILGGTNGFQVTYKEAGTGVTTMLTPPSTTSAANTTSTTIGGSFLIYASSTAGVTYTFGYTSVGATAMRYNLYVITELVSQ